MLELPTELRFDERGSFDIESYRHTNEGRDYLVEQGLWTPEQAARRAKQQHRPGAKTRSGPFVAWDGEGLTEKGRHNYIMLCNSERDIIRRASHETIPTLRCLRMLCDIGQRDQSANHVVFGGSYDANMMLGDLSFYECQELAVEGVVHWHDYRIEYRPRKFLMVTQYNGRHFTKNKITTITLWDVIGFFQQTFVRTLQDWEIGSVSDTEFISRMKQERSSFNQSNASEIERYCFKECEQLVEVMTKLRNHTRALDLTPTRWDGAGALGGKMLQKYKVRSFMDQDINPKVNRVAQYGYFGGRIELVQFGNYHATTYAHDIVSAYPYAMTHLPCLACGKWVKGKRPLSEFAIGHVRFAVDLRHIIYPFPWRSDRGLVYFPPHVEGWYWKPEIDNMRTYFPRKGTVSEWWSFIPGCDHQPFSFIPEVFRHRQRLKKSKNLAEKILKLGLNSLYGKLCQQVGHRDGKPPRYHQLEWAGYITSFTRARIFALAMTNPESVIAFETDGLYATEPLTTDGDSSLGSWEVKEYGGITYVQSGVYWVYDINDQRWKPKYRGFDEGSLKRDDIVSYWLEGERKLEASSTRFRGLMTSTVSPERFVDWKQWVTEPRTITLFPRGKRVPAREGRVPEQGLIRTMPTGGGGWSEPHKLAWVDGEVKTLAGDEYYLEDMGLDENGDEF